MELETTDENRRKIYQEVLELENSNERSMLKVRDSVKKILDLLKTHRRETYDDVITNLIITHAKIEKDIPDFILRTLNDRFADIDQGRVYSSKEAKEKVFGDEKQ